MVSCPVVAVGWMHKRGAKEKKCIRCTTTTCVRRKQKRREGATADDDDDVDGRIIIINK